MQVEPAAARTTIEAVDVIDPIMRKNWGPRLHRIVVESAGAGTVTFRFAASR